ncbi:hypothetical protein D3C71_758690 [compost metagenome]
MIVLVGITDFKGYHWGGGRAGDKHQLRTEVSGCSDGLDFENLVTVVLEVLSLY